MDGVGIATAGGGADGGIFGTATGVASTRTEVVVRVCAVVAVTVTVLSSSSSSSARTPLSATRTHTVATTRYRVTSLILKSQIPTSINIPWADRWCRESPSRETVDIKTLE